MTTYRVALENGAGSMVLESGAGYIILERGAPPVPANVSSLDCYDNLNGSVVLEFSQLSGPTGDSFNVYVNGALYANTTTVPFTVSGLQVASYDPGTQVQTPALTYDIYVTAVSGGVEVATSNHVYVTPQPASVMLLTPMKRLWPFPNTGLD